MKEDESTSIMPRYNLALLPVKKKLELIKLAKRFDDNADIDYLLGEHSIPHITLAQFRTADQALLEKIWQNVINKLAQINFTGLQLHLNGLDWHVDLQRDNYVWLQLLPDNHPLLHDLHKEIVRILEQKGIALINKSLDNYEPHLTLVHTTNFSYVENHEAYPMNVEDTFSLALGESDEIGQLTRILKTAAGNVIF